MISKDIFAENLAYVSMVCSVPLKNLRKLHKISVRPKKLTEADEYLRVISLRNRKKSSKNQMEKIVHLSGP